MIGMGGNNDSTLCATILANKHQISWHTKGGVQRPNYIDSFLRASTFRIDSEPGTAKEIHVPICDVLPMVHPDDLVFGGWDVSSMPMDKAMERACVLDYDLQRRVKSRMALLGSPLPSIYYPDFIAANQEARADTLSRVLILEHIRADIRRFKAEHQPDPIVVFWTANTERYSDIIPGVNDTADSLLTSIRSSQPETSPLTLFAVAAILEGEPFVNGAPPEYARARCHRACQAREVFHWWR